MRNFGFTAAAALAVSAIAVPSSAATTLFDTDTTDTDNDVWTIARVTEGGSQFLTPAQPADSQLPPTYAKGATLPSGWTGSWITPSIAGSNPGTYNFRAFFELSNVGDLLANNMISWFADNGVSSISVNGQNIFSATVPANAADFGPAKMKSAFFNSSRLNEGLNEVTFVTVNTGTGIGGNPVSLNAMAMNTAVPEPGAWLLMILGLGAIGFAMRSRGKAAVHIQFA